MTSSVKRAVVVGGSISGLLAATCSTGAGSRSPRRASGRSARGPRRRYHHPPRPAWKACRRPVSTRHRSRSGSSSTGRVALGAAGEIVAELDFAQWMTSWSRLYDRCAPSFRASTTGQAQRSSGSLRTPNPSRPSLPEASGSAPTCSSGQTESGRRSGVSCFRTSSLSTAATSRGDASRTSVICRAGLARSASTSTRCASRPVYRRSAIRFRVPTAAVSRDSASTTSCGITPSLLTTFRACSRTMPGACTRGESRPRSYGSPFGTRWLAHARANLAPQFAEAVTRARLFFFQPIVDLEAPRLLLGRVVLIGDAGSVARPHTAMGVPKAAGDALALAAALEGPDALAANLAGFEQSRLRAHRAVVGHGRKLGAYLESLIGPQDDAPRGNGDATRSACSWRPPPRSTTGRSNETREPARGAQSLQPKASSRGSAALTDRCAPRNARRRQVERVHRPRSVPPTHKKARARPLRDLELVQFHIGRPKRTDRGSIVRDAVDQDRCRPRRGARQEGSTGPSPETRTQATLVPSPDTLHLSSAPSIRTCCSAATSTSSTGTYTKSKDRNIRHTLRNGHRLGHGHATLSNVPNLHDSTRSVCSWASWKLGAGRCPPTCPVPHGLEPGNLLDNGRCRIVEAGVVVGRHQGKPDARLPGGTVGGLIAIARRPRSRSARRGQGLPRCRRSLPGRSASPTAPCRRPRLGAARETRLPSAVAPLAGRPLHERCRSRRRSPTTTAGGSPVEKMSGRQADTRWRIHGSAPATYAP